VGLANLGSESETCVGSRVHLVGVSISFKKNFYRLPFTPPSLVRRIGPSVTQLKKGMPVPENEVITEANAWIEPDFSLIEHPLRVLDQKERKTRRQTLRGF
jgi:hypothetical protein